LTGVDYSYGLTDQEYDYLDRRILKNCVRSANSVFILAG
jgi:hypothetical protein